MSSISGSEIPFLDRPSSSQVSTETPSVLPSRWHYCLKFCETVFIAPASSSVKLTYRLIKLLTWDVSKAGVFAASGKFDEAGSSLKRCALKTARVAKDLCLLPLTAASAFTQAVSRDEGFLDDFEVNSTQSYLTTGCTKKFDLFSSYLHGKKAFEVIQPLGIEEFAAESDGSLNAVMASHFLKPGLMAINLGVPNVAAFCTVEKEDGSTQTVKVDAKSLKRAEMTFHETNGKIQSGVFFVPKNLPKEALERFQEAARNMEGRKDITCVKTNCFVLKEAGFSIEGVDIGAVTLPTTFMEHLLFKNFIYTDREGNRHKVHFDIVNTTKNSLEEHFDIVDLAVLDTPGRHRRRNADSQENRLRRKEQGSTHIQEEKKRLAQASVETEGERADLSRRKVTVSVPSGLGDAVAKIWGRHTLYEVDLSDKQQEIAKAFEGVGKLAPFFQENPSLSTRIKRDFLFSKPVINFLRRRMVERSDVFFLNRQELFQHLESTEDKFNYVILDDKIILSRVQANGANQETHRKIADWALSKHALLASRQEVYCSGELFYNRESKRFTVNNDSGTYTPDEQRVQIAVGLVNCIFGSLEETIFNAEAA